jgi:hypothetical protein
VTPSCASCTSPLGDDAVICSACAARLEKALVETEAVVRELDLTLARQSTRVEMMGVMPVSDDDENRTLDAPALGVHVQKLPYDRMASEALGTLRSRLVGWVRVALEEREEAAWPRDTLPAMAAYLLARLEWLRHHAAAKDILDEIVSAVEAVERVTDRYVDRWYVGTCGAGDCHEPLYCAANATFVACATCRSMHDVGARRAKMLDELDDKLATADECSWAVSHSLRQVNPARIRKWSERGRIFAHGVNAKGQPLYRVGDVLDLLAGDEAREAV